MIDVTRATATLRSCYPSIEEVSKGVLRALEKHDGAPYAVRYFDLSDNLMTTVENLRDYQDSLLGTVYFDPKAVSDLRWNHYLYFVTSEKVARQSGFIRAKVSVESDTEYARKQVVLEGELGCILEQRPQRGLTRQQLPPNLMATWMQLLDKKGLGFSLDENIQVPEVVRRIRAAKYQHTRRSPTISKLDSGETAAGHDFLSKMTIKGFRKYPLQREFDFGEVNLIIGVNGVGKTSLLEAIEYLYCGNTRRGNSSRLSPRTEVSATLKRSSLTFTTNPSTELKKLRARHLGWYGKTEIKSHNVYETFGKFNFLNTDAAVGLTVEESKERISHDVTQLLLGAEASKALDRLNRVYREVTDTKKSIDKDIEIVRSQQREASDRLDASIKTPLESDQYFSQLLMALNRLEWLEPPTNKGTAVHLSKHIQLALTEAQTLEKLGLPQRTLTEHALTSKYSVLKNANDSAKKLVSREIDINTKNIEIERNLPALLQRVAAVDALAPYVSSGMEMLLQRRQVLGKSIGSLVGALASAQTAEAYSPRKDLPQQPLGATVKANSAKLATQRKEAAEAKRALEDFEKSQARLAILRQRLRNVAQEILSQVEDPDHCPLCHTTFQPGEFLRQMLSDVDTASEAISSQLRGKLQISESAFAVIHSEATALQALEDFIGPKLSETISVAEALKRLAKARQQLIAEQEELSTLDIKLHELEASGLTTARLHELKTGAQIEDSLPTPQGFLSLKNALTRNVEKLRQHLKVIEDQRHELEKECKKLAHSCDIKAPVSAERLNQQVRDQLNVFERALQAVQRLGDLMRLSQRIAPAELTVQLGQVQRQLVKLLTAVARDVASNEEGSKAADAVKNHMKTLEGLRLQMQRVTDAKEMLEELLDQHSEKAFKLQILKDNGNEIARIFSSIHTPNEFDLRTDESGLRIMRRDGGHSVDLNEMSSGQRAAYALSLFLAMNATLGEQGPKVLLFDDPVSHADDLNVLSFLDYLRKLALTETRQIFFATANAKLAGLVRHKFRFLGEQRFREITLTRDE